MPLKSRNKVHHFFSNELAALEKKLQRKAKLLVPIRRRTLAGTSIQLAIARLASDQNAQAVSLPTTPNFLTSMGIPWSQATELSKASYLIDAQPLAAIKRALAALGDPLAAQTVMLSIFEHISKLLKTTKTDYRRANSLGDNLPNHIREALQDVEFLPKKLSVSHLQIDSERLYAAAETVKKNRGRTPLEYRGWGRSVELHRTYFPRLEHLAEFYRIANTLDLTNEVLWAHIFSKLPVESDTLSRDKAALRRHLVAFCRPQKNISLERLKVFVLTLKDIAALWEPGGAYSLLLSKAPPGPSQQKLEWIVTRPSG